MAGKNHGAKFEAIVASAKKQVTEIDVDAVEAMLPAGKSWVLVDVREESEYATDHLPGAKHLGKGVIERDIEAAIPDTATPLVLYCGGGYRSALAVASIQAMGYTHVKSMAGGIRAWREAGKKLE